jgi:hypothetical protein
LVIICSAGYLIQILIINGLLFPFHFFFLQSVIGMFLLCWLFFSPLYTQMTLQHNH